MPITQMIYHYGLDSFALSPPWSLVISILLVFGAAKLGLVIERLLIRSQMLLIQNDINVYLLSPVFGLTVLGVFLYPFLLYGKNYSTTIYFIAISIIIFGLLFCIDIFFLIKNELNSKLLLKQCTLGNLIQYKSLFILLIVGLSFIACAPPTDGDELNYHLGVPLAILNSGSWIFAPEWFTSRLAGMGEALITLGLSVGAEQFGSLVQFSGLVAINTILIMSNRNKNSENTRFLYPLIFTSAPVLMWLVSTSKPLLLPISMVTLALGLILPILDRNCFIKKAIFSHFLIACTLLLCATQMKFNFFLSGFLVGLLWLLLMARYQFLRKAIALGLLLSAIIILPPAIWKTINFGGHWYENIFLVFPGNWPGYDIFEYKLRHWREDHNLFFPVNLLLTIHPGQFTTIMGIGVIFWIAGLGFLLNKNMKSFSNRIALCFIILLAILSMLLGQLEARFFIEPLVWLLLLLAAQRLEVSNFLFKNSILKIILKIQSLVVVLGCFTMSAYLIPGAFSAKLRTTILDRFAYQHVDMQWVNKILPQNAIVLSEERAMAEVPRRAISLEWMNYVNPISLAGETYLNRIKLLNPTHLLATTNPETGYWKNCLINSVIGPLTSQVVTRSPFNKGGIYFVWLAEINSQALPDCIQDNYQSKSFDTKDAK